MLHERLIATRLQQLANIGQTVYEHDIIVVLGRRTGRAVLRRNDRAHDERGILPVGNSVGGAAVRFAVEDPDECERQAAEAGLPFSGRPRTRRGDASWCSPIPMAARSSSPV